MTSELKKENNASISRAVLFTKTNFLKDKYTLIYFTIYIKFLQRIILLQIVRKMENTKRLKIPDTCIVRYYFHFYTGQRAKIPDCPVKYRTPGNPSTSLSGTLRRVRGFIDKQRCHSLGFLSRSWVFRSDLGFWGFSTEALVFFWVFSTFHRKIHFFECFYQKV